MVRGPFFLDLGDLFGEGVAVGGRGWIDVGKVDWCLGIRSALGSQPIGDSRAPV